MLVECVDDGVLSHVFEDFPDGEIEANEVMGLLARDEEEHKEIRRKLEDMMEEDRNNQNKVAAAVGFPEGTIMWEGYLASEPPVDTEALPEGVMLPFETVDDIRNDEYSKPMHGNTLVDKNRES